MNLILLIKIVFNSKFEHHGLFIISQFFKEILLILFEQWWSAENNERLLAWRWHVLLEHFFCYEANSLIPIFLFIRFDIDCEVKFKLISVVRLKLLQLVSEQNIINGPVSKNK